MIKQDTSLNSQFLFDQINRHFCVDDSSNPLNLVVAFSGGCDSIALLHCLQSLDCKNIRSRAVHINHGLHPNANDWTLWCENFCREYAIAFTSLPVQLPMRGNLENNARRHRYQAIKSDLKPNEVLLTAHHLDDQMITMLMRLMKGTSLRGIMGIQSLSKLFGMQVFRPLLSQLKKDLISYNQLHGLQWLNDPSNKDLTIERNLFKHQILPYLQRYFPRFSLTAYDTSQHFLEQKLILDTVAKKQYDSMYKLYPHSLCSLDMRKVEKLSIPDRKNLLFYLADKFNLELNASHIKHVIESCERYFQVRKNNFILLNWKQFSQAKNSPRNYFFHIYNQYLHLYSQGTADTALGLSKLDLSSNSHNLADNSELYWSEIPSSLQDKALFVLSIDQVNTLIWPKRGTLKRKNIVQELAIPPWSRAKQPIVIHLDNQPAGSLEENQSNGLRAKKVELVSIPNYIDIYGKWNYVTK